MKIWYIHYGSHITPSLSCRKPPQKGVKFSTTGQDIKGAYMGFLCLVLSCLVAVDPSYLVTLCTQIEIRLGHRKWGKLRTT